MNGHPRDQAKVSVHCRWPLVTGTDGQAGGVIFFSTLVPGSGNFQLSRLVGLGYGLVFWVVFTILVSLTLTLTLITTLTVILP